MKSTVSGEHFDVKIEIVSTADSEKSLFLVFLALTLENMFSVIALDPDGISKKFLCLNNFSINSRKIFAFAKFR